jgi:hypothetical protein
MKRLWRAGWVGLITLMVGNLACPGEEAAGRVTETGFNTLKMDDKGTLRQFHTSARTQYEPSTWRPGTGDEISITYAPGQSRRGVAILAVGKMTLVKPGPETVTDLASPVVVEIVEVGSSGVRGRLPKGQVVKFATGRGTQRVPAGWVIAVGERARITFQAKPNRFSGGLVFAVDRIEKL